MISRSLNVPGSDSSALTTRYAACPCPGEEARLAAHREAGAAAAAQVRGEQLVDDGLRLHPARLLERARSRRPRGTRRAASGRARRAPGEHDRCGSVSHRAPPATIAGTSSALHGLAVAVVDRDDRAPAAAAEALDRAQRDLAVVGRLARPDAELAARTPRAPAARRRARTRGSCRPRPGAGRRARGGTCRRTTRPPRSRPASGRARRRPRGTPRAGASRSCSCASRSAGSIGRARIRVLRADLAGSRRRDRAWRRHRSTSPITASSEPTIAIMSAISASRMQRRRRLRGDERRRAELDAPRLRPAVGDDVAAELAARRLDRHVDLALRHAEALGDDLEVVDQRLHRGVQLLARRQHDLAVVRDPRLALHAPRAGRGTARRSAPTRASPPCARGSGRRRRRSV